MKKRKQPASSTSPKPKKRKQAGATAAWHDLPAAALLQVFQNLNSGDGGLNDVRRAGTVCKQWLSMAQDVLLDDTAASRPKRFAGASKLVSRPTTTTRATTVAHGGHNDGGFEACSRQRPPDLPHPSTMDATCSPAMQPPPQHPAGPPPPAARAPSNPSSTRAITTLAASRAPLPPQPHAAPRARRRSPFLHRHRGGPRAHLAPSNDHSNSEAVGPLRPAPSEAIGPLRPAPSEAIGPLRPAPSEAVGPLRPGPSEAVGPLRPAPSEAIGPLRLSASDAGQPSNGPAPAAATTNGLHRLASASAPDSAAGPLPSNVRADASASRQMGTITMGGGREQTLVSDAGNGGEEVEGGLAPAGLQEAAGGARQGGGSASRSSTLSQQVSGLLASMWRRWR